MRLLRLALAILLGPAFLALAVASAGAAVAAHLGEESLSWDILAQFAPVWLAGGLLAILAAWLLRGVLGALLLVFGLVATGAAGLLIAPEFVRDAGRLAPADAPGQLKVIQFNVWARNVDLPGTVDWLIGQDPDIVILEETRPEIRRLLAERTNWRATCAECEVMILSKARPVATMGLNLPGKPPGPLARATFRDAQGEFTVVGVHYAWPTDAADQQAQERRLAQVIAMFPKDRTIVAGDFNSTPWSFFRRRWDAEFGLIRRDRALFTWPASHSARGRWLAPFPFLAIDHVYAGPGWATVKVARGPKLGSDHYPVVMTLAPVSPLH